MTNIVPLRCATFVIFNPCFCHSPDLMISDIHIEKYFIVPVEHYVISSYDFYYYVLSLLTMYYHY